jgi:hypothetical protein
MKRTLLAIPVVVTVLAIAPANGHAQPTALVLGARSHAAPLFKDSFKTTGIKGWKQYPEFSASVSSWRVNRKGILIFNGPAQGAAEVQAPFSVAHLTNFAVQAQIQAVGQPSDSRFSGFGIVVRNADQPAPFTPAATATGVLGGMYSSPGGAELVWYPDEVGGAAPMLHAGYNTFRVEVHANDYSLLINGQLIVRFPITLSHIGTHIGVWALSQKLQVKAFQVFRLPSAAALPAIPPIKAQTLGPSDLPSGFGLAGRADYSTPAEFVRLNNVTHTAESAAGFVLGYYAYYLAPTAPTSGLYLVYSEVDAYTSAENAHAAASSNWANTAALVKAGVPDSTDLASGDVSGLGDEAHWFSFNTTETYYGSSFKVTVLSIVFHQGTFEDLVSAQFVQGTVSHDDMLNEVKALAATVDARSQQPSGRTRYGLKEMAGGDTRASW